MKRGCLLAAAALGLACARDASLRAAGLEVRSSPYGDYIADDAGRAFYSFSGDAANERGCLENCGSVWVPVLVGV
jgi:predicted lipoprotein with Yx(FWY)xxD motif